MAVQQRGRQNCDKCGASMRHQGKSEPINGGHHGTVFYCPSCDERRLRG